MSHLNPPHHKGVERGLLRVGPHALPPLCRHRPAGRDADPLQHLLPPVLCPFESEAPTLVVRRADKTAVYTHSPSWRDKCRRVCEGWGGLPGTRARESRLLPCRRQNFFPVWGFQLRGTRRQGTLGRGESGLSLLFSFKEDPSEVTSGPELGLAGFEAVMINIYYHSSNSNHLLDTCCVPGALLMLLIIFIEGLQCTWPGLFQA